ncbi:MAG: type IV pilin protein, partial [Candidatus Omnitrophota bacterium]
MQFFYQKGTKGFTLTEIITAVVIVAILASLSIPYFTKTIEISRGRIAKANLESIYSAQRIYRDK